MSTLGFRFGFCLCRLHIVTVIVIVPFWEFWDKVLWTDETKINLYQSDKKAYIGYRLYIRLYITLVASLKPSHENS